MDIVQVVHFIPSGRVAPYDGLTNCWPPAKVSIIDIGTDTVITWATVKAGTLDGLSAHDWLVKRGYKPVLGADGVWFRPSRYRQAWNRAGRILMNVVFATVVCIAAIVLWVMAILGLTKLLGWVPNP